MGDDYHYRMWQFGKYLQRQVEALRAERKMREGLNESGRCDSVPVQLPLEFPNVNGTSIRKPRT